MNHVPTEETKMVINHTSLEERIDILPIGEAHSLHSADASSLLVYISLRKKVTCNA